MKVSYKLLRELLPFDYTPEELAEKFTMTGSEVESIDYPSKWLSDVVVAEIISVESDEPRRGLTTCTVFCGEKYITITGAPDVNAGDKAAFAKPGAMIFGGKKIGTIEIAGEKSDGMLLSGVEVGLNLPKSRLLAIPDDAKPGTDLRYILGWLDEAIFEMEITPNRPDCYGHWGLAREIAALLGTPWEPEIYKPKKTVEEDGGVSVKILTPNCRRYTARLIKGVKIAPSPLWLAGKLATLGIRPINNIVDITNYVMMLTGQPIHAFDRCKLGQEIIVRQAEKNEMLTTLDGVERKLTQDVMLIATPTEPVALAGIMGGADSEVGETTTDIVVEVAHFNAATVRRGSKAVGLSTESSVRFEKGTDPEAPPKVSDIVAALSEEIADAEEVCSIVDEYPQPLERKLVALTDAGVKKLLGKSVSREECRRILVSLGFNIASENAGGTAYIIPGFRPDVSREVDLIEEIGRIHGLWNIPARLRAQGALPPKIPSETKFQNFIEDFLLGLGYHCAMTDPLGRRELFELFGATPLVELSNPLSEDLSVMRPNPLPTLISAVARNLNRGVRSAKLFEIDLGYEDDVEYHQRMYLAIAAGGMHNPIGWGEKDRSIDLYDVKGTVEAIADRLMMPLRFEPTSVNFTQPNEALDIIVDDKCIGIVGTLAKKVRDLYDLRQPVSFALMDILPMLSYYEATPRYKKFSRFPSIRRDIALIVDEELPAQELLSSAEMLAQNAETIGIFDVYRGRPIQDGKKSLGLYFIFRSAEKTLTDEDVNEHFEQLVTELCEKFNAEIRKQ